METVTETHLQGVRLSRRGKVRELYDLGDSLLLVASDRISAFDCVLSPGIPDKGKILTQLSTFWFRQFADVENHLIETEVEHFPNRSPRRAATRRTRCPGAQGAGRAVRVRRAGSRRIGVGQYRKTGRVCGIALPAGLSEAEKLPEPIFTPATKAEHGHDENISFDQLANGVGTEEASRVRDLTLSLYGRAAEYAATRGLILADTKLEFGRKEDGNLIWIDEAFTPDSSRYWAAKYYATGRSPASFDKQFVRDWLETTGWDKRPPAPKLPEGVVRTTREKHLEAFRLLTGSMPAHLAGS
jgi:phosphoribosylaminoimidazole-succinocarboxamide synthase